MTLEELRLEERAANAKWHEHLKIADELSAKWVHLNMELQKAEREAAVEAEVQRRLQERGAK